MKPPARTATLASVLFGACGWNGPSIDFTGKTCLDGGCPAPYTCNQTSNQCELTDAGCLAPRTTCAGACIDPTFDNFDCGACGTVCPHGTLCLGKSCQIPAPLPTPRAALAVVAGLDGKVYTLGGGDVFPVADVGSAVTYDTVEIYDPGTNTWTEGPTLPIDVEFAGAAVGPDGTIYLAGGQSIDAGAIFDLPNLQAFDPAAQSWSISPASAPLPSSGAGFVYVAPDTLQMSGGYNGGTGSMDTVSVFSLDAGAWTLLPAQLPSPRDSLAAVVTPTGEVFVVGGTYGFTRALDDVAFELPGETTWQAGPSLEQKRARLAAVVGPNGDVYAIGGADESGAPLASVEVYQAGAQSWSTGVPLPAPRSNLGAAIAGDGRLYVVGGISLQGSGVTLPATVEAYDFQLNAWVP